MAKDKAKSKKSGKADSKPNGKAKSKGNGRVAQGMGADADPALVDDLVIRTLVDSSVADETSPVAGLKLIGCQLCPPSGPGVTSAGLPVMP